MSWSSDTVISETPPRTPARARPQTKTQKMEAVLQCIKKNGFSLNSFLYNLFRLENDDAEAINTRPPAKSSSTRVAHSQTHTGMLTALLNGQSKPRLGTILNEIWRSSLDTKISSADRTSPGYYFNPDVPIKDLEHGLVVLATWSASVVSKLVEEEGALMSDRGTGLHLRAQAKEGGRGSQVQDLVTWDDVDAFSFAKMEDIAMANAPIIRQVMLSYMNKKSHSAGGAVAAQRYRPKNLVSIYRHIAYFVLRFVGMHQCNNVAHVWSVKSRQSFCPLLEHLDVCSTGPKDNVSG